MFEDLTKKYNFSEKQVTLIDYLMKRLGFENNQFSKTYIDKLASIAHIYRNNRAIYDKEMTIPKYYYYDGEKYVPEKYNIIDFLIDEYILKKKQDYNINTSSNAKLSASDLANYTYCPIGYSIGKSFEIKANELAETGERLHEKARLSSHIEFGKITNEYEKIKYGSRLEEYINNKTLYFFNLLFESTPLYLGHVQNEKKYFINEALNFIGQPDYVFQDKNGNNYIIEEKFIKKKDQEIDSYYNNHLIQLASYMYFLKEFNAKYGFIVYWTYGYFKNEYVYEKCFIKRIDKNPKIELFLKKIYYEIDNFKKHKYYNQDLNRLNPTKCASCVFCRYCGHKNGKFKQVTIPYQRCFHRLYKAEYPELLKVHNNGANNDIINNYQNCDLPPI